MTRIRLEDGLVLYVDSTQWIIGRERERTDKQTGEREQYVQAEQFFGRLDHALLALVDRRLRESDATTFAELCDVLKRTRDELRALLELT